MMHARAALSKPMKSVSELDKKHSESLSLDEARPLLNVCICIDKRILTIAYTQKMRFQKLSNRATIKGTNSFH